MSDLRATFAEFLGMDEEDLDAHALSAAIWMHRRASLSHNQIVEELARRYGKDAPVSIRLVSDTQAKVLIDGEERDDVIAAFVCEGDTVAHVFLDLVGWHPEDMATVRIGHDVLLTRPLAAFAQLPWPPDPSKTLVARLGDLLEPGGQGFVIENGT